MYPLDARPRPEGMRLLVGLQAWARLGSALMVSYGDILARPPLAERIAEFLASKLFVVELLSVNGNIHNQHLRLIRDMLDNFGGVADLRADLRRARQPRLYPEPRRVTQLRRALSGTTSS